MRAARGCCCDSLLEFCAIAAEASTSTTKKPVRGIIARFLLLRFGQIVTHYFAVLHHKANALQFGDIRQRVPANCDKVCEFPGLNRTNAVLPAQPLCRMDGDGTNDIEGGHSRVAQIRKGRSARLATGVAWIKPAHVRSRSKLHARLQHSLDEVLVLFIPTCTGADSGRASLSRQHYGRLHDLQEKAAISGWRKVEENAFVAHLPQLLVARVIAVLNRICAGVDSSLNAGLVDGMHGNFQVLTVCLFDYR